ncbi:MAG: DUF3617 family protein [Candidatus Competibacteraceae bacterium]|nr:DUF3617 family protein [Candidatus Competibacteraceae bacterium]
MNKVAIITLATALTSTVGMAQSLSIKPGLWETTETSINPMSGEPKTSTQQECITPDKATFDPSEMVEGNSECQITDKDLNGNTLTFTLVCPVENGKAKATGTMTSDGDQGKGDMVMEMTINGQTMTFQMNWEAKRIGDC